MISLRIHQGCSEARGQMHAIRERLVKLRDRWEERAAILEYEAGLPRDEAETTALGFEEKEW